MENNQDVLLKVEHLKKYYSIKSSSLRGKKSVVKAVDDISSVSYTHLDVYKRQIVVLPAPLTPMIAILS